MKAFLKAGILGEDGNSRETDAGTPQGSILSPLLSNVALSVLDEHIAQAPGGPGVSRNDRLTRRRHGLPNYRLVPVRRRLVPGRVGHQADAEALREEIAGVLSTMGLRLSPEKTLITHIDEGLDFLGWHIQRRRKRGTNNDATSTPTRRPEALKAVTAKVRTVLPAEHQPAARSPAAPAQPGAAGLDRPLPTRGVQRRLRLPARLHLAPGRRLATPQTPPDELEGTPTPLHQPADGGPPRRGDPVQPRGGSDHPLPLPGHARSPARGRAPHDASTSGTHRGLWRAGCVDEAHVRFGGRPGKRTGGNTDTAPRADPTT